MKTIILDKMFIFYIILMIFYLVVELILDITD